MISCISRLSTLSVWENFSDSPTWSTRPVTGCEARSASPVGPLGKKIKWHATRQDSLSKTILQVISEGGRRCGQQRKCWMDSVKEWASLPTLKLLTMASRTKRLEVTLRWIVPHVPPMTQLVKGLCYFQITVYRIHLRGSTEEVLGGQRQRMDVPAHARTAQDGLPKKWLKNDLC